MYCIYLYVYVASVLCLVFLSLGVECQKLTLFPKRKEQDFAQFAKTDWICVNLQGTVYCLFKCWKSNRMNSNTSLRFLIDQNINKTITDEADHYLTADICGRSCLNKKKDIKQ